MAIVPRTFFSPLWASLRTVVPDDFRLAVDRIAAAEDHLVGGDIVNQRVGVEAVARRS